MNLAEVFVRRRIGTSLLAFGLALLGAVAFQALPVAPLPQVDFPTIQVQAKLPGASPDTMASSVTSPLERAFSSIAGVSDMTSTSALGVAQITLVFDLSKNIDAAAADVQAAINSAQSSLPKSLPSPPALFKINPGEAPILSLAVTSETLPITELGRSVEDFIVPSLAQTPGVGVMDYHGQQRPAIRVQADPDKLAALGLGLDDVRTLIASQTLNAPKGTLNGERQAVTLTATDQLLDAAAFRALVLVAKDGTTVRLDQVASVIDAPEDKLQAAWLQGRRAIVIDIHKQAGFNVVETVRQVQQRLPELRAALPAGVRLVVVGDRTQTTEAAVHDVELTMLLTMALVVAVVWLFLGDARATLVPSLTIPLSLLGSFAVMYLCGYSLDNLSLMALVIAVGFVMDDAIVVVENVVRHLELGEEPLQATLNGTREVAFTIVSMTVSLIAVFIPILLMGDMVGRLFREFAVTLSAAVALSGVISLTVTPMLCAALLRHRPPRAAVPRRERVFAAVEAAYQRGLDRSLRHPRLLLALAVGTVALSGVLYATVPKGFFPEADTGTIDGFMEASSDISFAGMAERTNAVTAIIRADPAVDNVYHWIGSGASMSRSRMMVNLKPLAERDASAQQVVARLKKQAQALHGITLGLQVRQDVRVGGRITESAYQYTLQDGDLAELDLWSTRMFQALKALPELRDLASDRDAQSTSVRLRIDRPTAARLGISVAAIDDALYSAFGQRRAATLFTPSNQYYVIVEVDPHFQLTTEALDHVFVRAPTTGALVPLAMLATLERGVAAVSIAHQTSFPSVTLSFNLAPGVALGDAVAAIHRAEAKLGKPDSVRGSFQGTARDFENALRTQPWLVLAALVTVYIVLGVLYESLAHPLTILSTLPSAGIGALLALQLCGMDLSIIGLIGILLLIGIVKKNAIMMIDFALAAQRERGLSPQEAIREGALLRFRPIMMTTMGALMGALPLAFGTGVGSELRTPLGVAIAGGLIVSQALTLFTTPVVYLWVDRWAAAARGGRAVPARVGTGA